MNKEPLRTCPVSAAETWILRKKVLRPHADPSELNYPGDNEETSLHLASKLGVEIVAIASFYQQAPPKEYLQRLQETLVGTVPEKYYRLRGMAVEPKMQGRGLGSIILQSGIERLKKTNANSVLWCNARTSAISFYQRLGFTSIGPEFNIEKIGPHYLLYLRL